MLGRRKNRILRGTMSHAQGFTLVEVVVTLVLVGIIATVAFTPMVQAIRGWLDTTSREDVTQSGRIAMERIVREVRNIPSVTVGGSTMPCISTAAPSQLEFSILDGDTGTCNSIRYALVGTEIMRNGLPLADNVQSLNFRYFDAGNAVTAAVSDIHRVSVEIVSVKGAETLRKYGEAYLANMREY